MDYFSENRYKLLYIDDEGNDSDGGQDVQGQVNAGKQKPKRGKTPRDDKAKTLEMIKSLSQSLALSKLNLKLDGVNGSGASKAKQQQQLRQQLQQQLQKQMRQEEQLKQRQQGQQQGQQQNAVKERTYRERIINNSNRDFYAGATGGGFAGGRGYASAAANGVGPRPLLRNKLDRHSSSDKTGIKAIVKRNGGGSHNWGSALKDIEDQNLAMKQSIHSDTNDCNELQKQQCDDADDDTKYITVEQWRAMHAVRAKPVYNIRKPGEGEPNRPDWKKMTVLQKKKQQQVDDDYEYDPSMYPQRVGRLQRVSDIEFKFKDDRRRSGYLSSWSSRNLSKSNGEDNTEAIDMNDEAEFPTLG